MVKISQHERIVNFFLGKIVHFVRLSKFGYSFLCEKCKAQNGNTVLRFSIIYYCAIQWNIPFSRTFITSSTR